MGILNPLQAKDAIELTGGDNIKAKSIKPVEIKAGNNKGKAIGFIAEMTSFEDKVTVLRGSKNYLNLIDKKNFFLTLTKQQRKDEENL